MLVAFRSSSDHHLCTDLLSYSSCCILFRRYIQPCISYCSVRNESLWTWFLFSGINIFAAIRMMAYGKGYFSGLITFLRSFLLLLLFLIVLPLKFGLTGVWLAVPAKRSSDITRCCMVSAADSLLKYLNYCLHEEPLSLEELTSSDRHCLRVTLCQMPLFFWKKLISSPTISFSPPKN